MNELTSLIVALSAFLHDIGKIVDPVALNLPNDYEEKNADLYQRSYKGRYSHGHALLTAAFIESKKSFFPQDVFEWSTDSGDSFINLCAMHHKPETPLQWIITAADRLSSGLDRHSAEEEGGSSIDPRKYRQTRLRPIFEELSLEDAPDTKSHVQRRYAYPLARLSASSIFPVPFSDLGDKNSENVSRQQYSKLF